MTSPTLTGPVDRAPEPAPRSPRSQSAGPLSAADYRVIRCATAGRKSLAAAYGVDEAVIQAIQESFDRPLAGREQGREVGPHPLPRALGTTTGQQTAAATNEGRLTDLAESPGQV